MKIILPILFTFVSLPSFAMNLEKYGLGYGILNSGMTTESVSDSGEASIYGSFTFHFLTAHLRWSGTRYKYGLRLGYTILPREDVDGSVKVTQLLISPQFGVPIGGTGRTIWNTSLSFLRTESKGQGGTVTGVNGGSPATFFKPSNTSSSLLMNLETGLNYHFNNNWFLSGDLIFNGLLGDRRNMSLFVNFGYSWGQGGFAAAPAPTGRGY